jgi:hypothetical protein
MGVYADQLAAIRAAKTAILSGGQNVRYKDRQVTMADYAQLCADEKTFMALAAQEARAAAGGGRLGVTYVTPV